MVTSDQLKEFLGAKWDGHNCPWCGAREWNVGTDEQMKTLIPLRGDSGVSFPQSAPAYWVVCVNCGSMHFIAAQVVRRWLKEHEQNG